MTKINVNIQRRRLLVGAAASIATVPFIKGMLGSPAYAVELPHLEEDNATAKALKYRHDATAAPRVDKAGIPADKQFCHNCQFINANSGQWRPCQIFPGKAVNADGWCVSWNKKPG
jgi:hypothetical protein